MEAMGIVRRSSSPWSSPLHVVPKSRGGWRPCGDYRRLNTVTVDDRYPVPRLQDSTATLAGKTIFSKIDLVRAYHHVPMTPNDIPKTAVITPFGLYEFPRMPFGLKNAAQAFQRIMGKVCQGLARVFVYLDDILVASEDRHQHLRGLTELFGRQEDHGLVIKRTKCVFGVSSIDFLGHNVNAQGIVPLPEKVRAIRDFPRPSTVKGLQDFLGMINFYHRFVPHVAEILVPMHAALAGLKCLASLVWTPGMGNAFTASKNARADATLLIHPVEDAPTSLRVDAPVVAIGGVPEQRTNGVWRPLAVFSRKLQTHERTNYRRLIVNCLRHTLPYDISVTFSKAAISPYTLARTLSCPRYARQPTPGPVDNRINFRRSVSKQPMYATSLERTTRWRMRCLALPLTRLNLHKVSISMPWPLHRIAMKTSPIYATTSNGTPPRECETQLNDVTFVRYIRGCSTPRCSGAVPASRF